MHFIVDNAIIMAAGKSSRFAPLSYEKPKALIEVRGEVLIERQIRQLRAAGIDEIIVVTGYKSEDFEYLKAKFNVQLVKNEAYATRNNHSSLYAVRHALKNTYICSSDNYFSENPFEKEVDGSYYATVYHSAATDEWCPTLDEKGNIVQVTIGGNAHWVFYGHVFFDEHFSKQYVAFLEEAYPEEATKEKYWEDIYLEHTDVLKMKIRKYPDGVIHEFDSIEELRQFDPTYQQDTRSPILKKIAQHFHVLESELTNMSPLLDEAGDVIGFSFLVGKKIYRYFYEVGII
ncbi:NTP transferase domain-containing protein [Allofustis seminis]|uniref:NTP transferase domain-containing protein n=1 Tax=Allofustis seminis TaxID=166939 RepID=UPI00037066E7|nr:NTP transferase domain-containing protein [Allofustis seminis]